MVPEALSPRRGDATLGSSWKADGASLDTRRFALQIQSGNAGAPTLTERMRDGQTLYVLTLTLADAERLRDMQERIAATKGAEAKGRGSLASVSPAVAGPVRSPLTRRSRSMPGYAPAPTKATSRSCRGWI
ncbi:hypothetical protein AC244_10750 [Ensifer adhaerens]|uniref:Uncharacterized protein n=1 Tax=Ensifer adhaerens TaxID=106592 RepID=A0A0L8BYS2_ENSAD|nr:hypothetical protein AC244_10750 [Ensifer adhaerens]